MYREIDRKINLDTNKLFSSIFQQTSNDMKDFMVHEFIDIRNSNAELDSEIKFELLNEGFTS